ncbi:MAG TPA: CBS domain-containing protein [Acidimicrobiales bacterium]|jgi:CBS domain-containing protein|nr:CBS domain-containing protein [Acidimicrobiales bacterium]
MKVADVLKAKGADVLTIPKDAGLEEAVRKLKAGRVGALVVSDDGERVRGIVSERDIVRAVADHGAKVVKMHVRDVMSPAVVTCTPDEGIKSVMVQMTNHRSRHIPVVDNGKLAGIISIGDIVKNRLDELELETNVLRDSYIARH